MECALCDNGHLSIQIGLVSNEKDNLEGKPIHIHIQYDLIG